MWREAQQRLRLRQLELQLRSAELRLGVASDVRALKEPMHWAERGYSIWQLLRSLPRGWHAAGALGGLSGLVGLLMMFRRPGRLARWWAWLSLGRRIWRWMRPASRPTGKGSEASGPSPSP
ncbi:hypothetical protein [Roseateles amylovorans]|uniref:YqjK-like protein n=1 Tax=Roseateles amylovorans TaxID=2978473 RepID=A0ABY6B1G1_9BURK|nr:hypothetical protein [Roseateles amylovorans]UXH77824.1 hypothetical protein N4261_23085 [Roseateles amylovorans]